MAQKRGENSQRNVLFFYFLTDVFSPFFYFSLTKAENTKKKKKYDFPMHLSSSYKTLQLGALLVSSILPSVSCYFLTVVNVIFWLSYHCYSKFYYFYLQLYSFYNYRQYYCYMFCPSMLQEHMNNKAFMFHSSVHEFDMETHFFTNTLELFFSLNEIFISSFL